MCYFSAFLCVFFFSPFSLQWILTSFIEYDRKNIILRDAKECRIVEDASIYMCKSDNENDQPSCRNKIVERRLAQALIPGEHLVKVELVE